MEESLLFSMVEAGFMIIKFLKIIMGAREMMPVRIDH